MELLVQTECNLVMVQTPYSAQTLLLVVVEVGVDQQELQHATDEMVGQVAAGRLAQMELEEQEIHHQPHHHKVITVVAQLLQLVEAVAAVAHPQSVNLLLEMMVAMVATEPPPALLVHL